MFLLGSGVYLAVTATIVGMAVVGLGSDILYEYFKKEAKRLDKKEKKKEDK